MELSESLERFQDSTHELEIRRVQIMAQSQMLATAGIIPIHDDPNWLEECLAQVDRESLL